MPSGPPGCRKGRAIATGASGPRTRHRHATDPSHAHPARGGASYSLGARAPRPAVQGGVAVAFFLMGGADDDDHDSLLPVLVPVLTKRSSLSSADPSRKKQLAGPLSMLMMS